MSKKGQKMGPKWSLSFNEILALAFTESNKK